MKCPTASDLLLLAGHIIDLSTSFFKKPEIVDENQAMYFDLMAKRYGKMPVEFIATTVEFSELDAYMFNHAIFQNAFTKEQDQITRDNRKLAIQEAKLAMRFRR